MTKRSRRKTARFGRRTPVRIVSAEGADLLRQVPALAGVDTSDSMVVVVFRHGEVKRFRTIGAIRVDLRHTDDDLELERWAADVLTNALRVHGVVGVAPIAYTPDSFGPDGRPPAARQVRAVARQAERMGLEVVEKFTVGADAWGSLDDPALPRGGRPLSEIEPDEGVVVRPRGAVPVVEASPEAQVAFDRHYADWWARADGPGGQPHGVRLAKPGSAFGVTSGTEAAMERYRWGRDTAELLGLVEGMLEPHDPVGDEPCPCRALLLALAERQGVENLVLLQFGWGRAFAEELWRAVDAGAAGEPSLERLTAALSGGAFRRPDADRLDTAIAAVLETATLVPAPDRAPLDGMLAWLHWARGGSSAAAAYAQRSLALQPGRDVPSLVLAKVQRGELPQWAFRRNPAKRDRWALPA